MVVGEGLRLAVLGALAGLAAVLGLTRVMASGQGRMEEASGLEPESRG
jgi:hypothetical protein